MLGRRILIGITGGIAAYKTCEVISTLAKAGAEVRAILTKSACQFITPLTVATLCRHQAYTDADFWSSTHGRPLHIELGEWAEVMVIAPLSANTLAKLAFGMADNLLTNTVLASTCPLLLAPAMNTDMWEQMTVQHNWAAVMEDPRYHRVGPGSGVLACDRVGTGRMAEPAQILPHIQSLITTKGKRDLTGQQILITAGGTREHLDPARFIGNPSSGKMGVALAQAAVHRGANVTLIHGSIAGDIMNTLPTVISIPVTSAADMERAILNTWTTADIILMAAAVGDVRPRDYSPEKLSKQALGDQLNLEFIPDILAQLGERKKLNQRLIGFAAQTGDIVTPAKEKLQRKKLDAIVANPINKPHATFGSDTNEAIFIDSRGRLTPIPPCPKLQMAHQILDLIQAN